MIFSIYIFFFYVYGIRLHFGLVGYYTYDNVCVYVRVIFIKLCFIYIFFSSTFQHSCLFGIGLFYVFFFLNVSLDKGDEYHI